MLFKRSPCQLIGTAGKSLTEVHASLPVITTQEKSLRYIEGSGPDRVLASSLFTPDVVPKTRSPGVCKAVNHDEMHITLVPISLRPQMMMHY